MNATEGMLDILMEDGIVYPALLEIYRENWLRHHQCQFCKGNCRHFANKKFQDIYGQSNSKDVKDVLQCLNCTRMISYKKYAAHLQTCLGLGRNSRTAKRGKQNLGANGNAASGIANSQNLPVQDGDVLWYSQGSQSSVNTSAFGSLGKNLFTQGSGDKLFSDPLQGLPGFDDDESPFGDSDLDDKDPDDFDFVPIKEEASRKKVKSSRAQQQSLSPSLSEASLSSNKKSLLDGSDGKVRKKRGRRKKSDV